MSILEISSESVPSTSGALTPKPPPRRTNPFNRPAPPIPGTNGNIDTNMSFINGHFGSSSQRNVQVGKCLIYILSYKFKYKYIQ